MEEQLEPGFAREQLAIYDHAIATGRPFPASFFVHLGSNPRKRSLQSFHYDGSTCTEAMKQDYVRRLRALESSEGLVAIKGLFKVLSNRSRSCCFPTKNTLPKGVLQVSINGHQGPDEILMLLSARRQLHCQRPCRGRWGDVGLVKSPVPGSLNLTLRKSRATPSTIEPIELCRALNV